MQDETRRCGHCGEKVGEADITCPHCGALLAAYEPAPGSTDAAAPSAMPVPTADDITPTPEPVTIPEPTVPKPSIEPDRPVETGTSPRPHPYESVTGKSLSDLEHERPEVGATSSSFGPGNESPITQALRETRQAAELDEPEPDDDDDHDEPPAPSDKPISLAEAREVLGLDPEPKKTEPQTATRRPPRSRPTPEERADHRVNPGSRPIPQRPNPRPGVSIQALLGALFVIIVVAQGLGERAFLGIIVIPVLILGLLWFMRVMARNTGRKSTSMPSSRDHRR